nr:proline-rich protein 27 [Marmota flaviventris]
MKLLLWVCILCIAFARKKCFPFNKDVSSYGYPLNPSLDIPYGSPNDDFPTRRLPTLSYPQMNSGMNSGPKYPVADSESGQSPYPWVQSASGSPYVMSAASAEPASLSFESESAAVTSMPVAAEPAAESLSSELTADPLSSVDPGEVTDALTAAAKHAASQSAAVKYVASRPADVPSTATELTGADMPDTQSASAKSDAAEHAVGHSASVKPGGNKPILDKPAISESQPSPLDQVGCQYLTTGMHEICRRRNTTSP